MQSYRIAPIGLHEIDRLAELMAEEAVCSHWLQAWASQVLSGQRPGTHLAVMTGPYLDWLLAGKKTIESRFARNRCAPFGQVNRGDVVFFKLSSGPIVAAGCAGEVLHLDIHATSLDEIAEQYGDGIAPAGPSFWEDRAQAKYATLIEMVAMQVTPSVPVDKRDRRGWVVLSATYPSSQQMLF